MLFVRLIRGHGGYYRVTVQCNSSETITILQINCKPHQVGIMQQACWQRHEATAGDLNAH